MHSAKGFGTLSRWPSSLARSVATRQLASMPFTESFAKPRRPVRRLACRPSSQAMPSSRDSPGSRRLTGPPPGSPADIAVYETPEGRKRLEESLLNRQTYEHLLSVQDWLEAEAPALGPGAAGCSQSE
jgi:hypothetical protein